MDITKLLKPRSVAVVGASERDGFGGDTCRTMLTYMRDLSRVYFVNPRRDEVFGRPCCHSLSEIPDTIDLAILCTPQSTVENLLREAAAKGCRGAVVFASGYGETGAEGKALEAKLCALCEELGIAMMGPNCAGFANYVDNVFSFAFLTDERERRGNIGMVSQSGQVCLSALDSPGVGFSYLISCGNSANLRVEDYLLFLADDPDTSVLCAYVEGIQRPDTFIEALRRAALQRKPVVILKSGQSQKAARIAASHTGSLSGSDKAIGAILDKYGALRVDDIQELIATAQMFSVLPAVPATAGYASLNVSGGEAGVTADLAHLEGVRLVEFSARTVARLREIVPPYATPDNPLDMTATLAYDPEKLAQALRIVMAQPEVGAVIVGYTIPPTITDVTPVKMIDGIELVRAEADCKPIVWIPFVGHTPDPAQHRRLLELGVPALPAGKYGYRSLRHLDRFVRYRVEQRTLTSALPATGLPEETQSCSEYESSQLLRQAGIDPGPMNVVQCEEQLLACCELYGYPLVLKIDSPDIQHKSDVGGVRINLQSREAVVAAYRGILESVGRLAPAARINGVLVKPMVPAGLELIVGVNNDPQLGPIVMVGLGGVFVEVFRDVALYPAPFSRREALDMLRSLRAWPLLTGYRGGKEYDVDACAELLEKLSRWAAEHKDTLVEMDVNPLFVYERGKGVRLADALVVKRLK